MLAPKPCIASSALGVAFATPSMYPCTESSPALSISSVARLFVFSMPCIMALNTSPPLIAAPSLKPRQNLSKTLPAASTWFVTSLIAPLTLLRPSTAFPRARICSEPKSSHMVPNIAKPYLFCSVAFLTSLSLLIIISNAPAASPALIASTIFCALSPMFASAFLTSSPPSEIRTFASLKASPTLFTSHTPWSILCAIIAPVSCAV